MLLIQQLADIDEQQSAIEQKIKQEEQLEIPTAFPEESKEVGEGSKGSETKK